MCLLIVLSRVLPEWPLIVAANRDERYERPTAPVGPIASAGPPVLGGTDLLAGGTWLAVNRAGVVAGLTNKPSAGGRDPTKRSRGEIPLALASTDSAASALEAFASTFAAGEFNPCWALVGDRTSLFYADLTNPEGLQVVELPPGLHVLENRALGEPSDKVDYVKTSFRAASEGAGEVFSVLRALLRDHTVTRPAANLPEEGPWSPETSCCCVHTPSYGTRCSMVVRDAQSSLADPEVWASDGPSCENPLVESRFSAGFEERQRGSQPQ